MSRLLFDLETDGLKPSRIWVVGVLDLDTDEYTAYTGEDVPEGLMRVAEADLIAGHNIKGYDAKVVEDLTDGLIKLDEAKMIDTCEISRKLFPDLPNHKLETWGDIFEDRKIKYDKGFLKFHPEMLPYCEQDCRLNARVFRFMMEHLDRLDAEEG